MRSLLLRAGAIADAPGAGGVTPLIVATESRQLACVKLLLGSKGRTKGEGRGEWRDGAARRVPARRGCVRLGATRAQRVRRRGRQGRRDASYCRVVRRPRSVRRPAAVGAGADDTLKYEGKTAIDLAEEAGHADRVKALEGRLATEQDVIKMRAREMFPKPSKEVEDEEEESAIVDDLPDEDLTPKERSKGGEAAAEADGGRDEGVAGGGKEGNGRVIGGDGGGYEGERDERCRAV